jgi:hypothetical protein
MMNWERCNVDFRGFDCAPKPLKRAKHEKYPYLKAPVKGIKGRSNVSNLPP